MGAGGVTTTLGALLPPLLAEVVQYLNPFEGSRVLFRFSLVADGDNDFKAVWLSHEYSVHSGSWMPPFTYYSSTGRRYMCDEFWLTHPGNGALIKFEGGNSDEEQNGREDKVNSIRVVAVDAELLREANGDDLGGGHGFDFNGEGFGFHGQSGPPQPERDEEVADAPNTWLEGPYFRRMMVGGYEGEDYQAVGGGGGGCSVM